MNTWLAGFVMNEVAQASHRRTMGTDLEEELRALAAQLDPDDRIEGPARDAILSRLEPGYDDQLFQIGLWALYQGLRTMYDAHPLPTPPPPPPPWADW